MVLRANSAIESLKLDIWIMERQGQGHACSGRAVSRLGPLLHQLLRSSFSRRGRSLPVLRPHKRYLAGPAWTHDHILGHKPARHARSGLVPASNTSWPKALPPHDMPLSRTLSGAALSDSQRVWETHLCDTIIHWFSNLTVSCNILGTFRKYSCLVLPLELLT